MTRPMVVARCLILFGLALVTGTSSAFAAGDLKATLAKLDAAAAKFKSTSADFEFDSVVTDPIPDTEVQKGTAYYQRKGNSFQMAAHIREVNGKKIPKIYVYSQGKLKLDEPLLNQVTTLTSVSQYEGYVMLGFGASGTELAEKWEITDLGPETINGVNTEKLDLVAKDPKVKKNLPKVTIWIDLDRAVSLKQYFDEGQGQSRTCTYSNIKINESLPGDAFTFKTDSTSTARRILRCGGAGLSASVKL
jgi:outer membrane lipoprotein-sorting protein